MNSDIRLLISFKGHRKRKRLKRTLCHDATDYLIDLWITAAVDRPDGVLTGWDKHDIADAANWPEDKPPETLVNALIDCGWIDEINGTYHLHDWKEHQSWACNAQARSSKAKKAAEARWEKRLNGKNNNKKFGNGDGDNNGDQS